MYKLGYQKSRITDWVTGFFDENLANSILFIYSGAQSKAEKIFVIAYMG